MKATGIFRRIDDLGIVVIPKEIRRTMRIREGDPLEIYTSNDGEVIFKKYSPINELSGGAMQVAEVIYKLGNSPVIIFDRDHVVAVFPIISTGDITSAVTFLASDDDSVVTDNQSILAQTATMFLGKQIEE